MFIEIIVILCCFCVVLAALISKFLHACGLQIEKVKEGVKKLSLAHYRGYLGSTNKVTE